MTKTEYTIKTDAFEIDIEADSLDEAIEEAFDGEIGSVTDEESLRRKFARYERDGGWCWVECDGVRVLEIGEVG
jgi:hypothetical protein